MQTWQYLSFWGIIDLKGIHKSIRLYQGHICKDDNLRCTFLQSPPQYCLIPHMPYGSYLVRVHFSDKQLPCRRKDYLTIVESFLNISRKYCFIIRRRKDKRKCYRKQSQVSTSHVLIVLRNFSIIRNVCNCDKKGIMTFYYLLISEESCSVGAFCSQNLII